MSRLFEKYSLWVFLISLFLIKIPPFYLVPPFPNPILTTHSLARGLIVLVTGYLIVKEVKKGGIIPRSGLAILSIFSVYLFFQSFSLFGAANITAFLSRYKDIVFPGFFLLSVVCLKNNYQKIITVLIASTVFNFGYQMVMFFFPQVFKSLGQYFIYSAHFELVSINLSRARLFIETYDEIIIPFVMLLIFSSKNRKNRLLGVLFLLLIAVPSLLSNFRSRILMLILAFVGSFIFITGKKFLQKTVLLAALSLVGVVAVAVLNSQVGFSFIDRFTLQDTREDVATIQSRFNNIKFSLDVAKGYPFTGVGLGNYYDILPNSKSSIFSLINWLTRESEIASTNPHNIFAQVITESGVIGLLFYVGMLSYFLFKDSFLIFSKKPDLNKTALVISFWTLFTYSLFNPTTTMTYNSMFWILRGLI